MARTDSLGTDSARSLISKVLGDPSLYPDAFKQWIPRWVSYNVNFQLQRTQLPQADAKHFVGATGNAQFAGAWANFGGTNESAQYWIDLSSVVHLGGIVAAGVIGTVIFILPAGYRPQEAAIYSVASNGAFGIVTVNPDGTVVASAGNNTYISLSGITFRQFA